MYNLDLRSYGRETGSSEQILKGGTAMLPPPSGSTISENSATRWEPSIQTLEPVEEIEHPQYDKYL